MAAEHTTPQASGDWLSAHGDVLYRYALRLTRDPYSAEEIVQETLLAAWESRDRFAGGAAVQTWLIGILKHKVVDLFRRHARETSLHELDSSSSSTAGEDDEFASDGHWRNTLVDWGEPGAIIQQQQFLDALQRCMDRLPRSMAEVFRMREVLEEEPENICNELGISPTNLRTTLHRARMRLRQCLDRAWGGAAAPG